ncbi:DUF4244 domain-containing protein [Arthrobacter sp. CJ23]|uniref:DUF4244 domain-containing protein n=1 Tax=Arthrobacter sp. CJ23 TaxID=2972479 RepID=UPI00215D1F3A|nr:DUF4244 domain-containing protein [Arthrobacter sp. CJ23]UVJ38840.1 DUF4244 domain-containing protein [Arthrobacter sp. CJ23]
MQSTAKALSVPSATLPAQGERQHTAPSGLGIPARSAIAPRTASSPGLAAILELRPGSSPAQAVEQPGGQGAGRTVRSRARLTGSELGMATAEYAIATLAAVGFAGLLVVILRSDEVRGFLLNLIRTALSLP